MSSTTPPPPWSPLRLHQQSVPRSSQTSVVTKWSPVLQSSSYGESISTLGFGSRVSEITLGQAKKNSESAQIFEAKDQMIRCACLSVCVVRGDAYCHSTSCNFLTLNQASYKIMQLATRLCN